MKAIVDRISEIEIARMELRECARTCPGSVMHKQAIKLLKEAEGK